MATPDIRADNMRWINTQVPCDGIDGFYTGSGFFSDYGDLLVAMNYEDIDDGFDMKTPEHVGESTWDCEDRSHAIYCLGRLYGVECNTYYSVSYRMMSNNREHFGVECYVYGDWMVLI